jgi:hypothetical protein
MNNSLLEGTQFEYIKRAKKQGFAVLVLNTNQNESVEDGKRVKIPQSETPQNHAHSVWKEIVSKVPWPKIQFLCILPMGPYFYNISGPCQAHCNCSSQLWRNCHS